MRKHYTSYILHLAPIIAAALMTASCTLSTEEWVIPEEEKGFDEQVTVENEYGTITYQFNDDVIYVTDNLQEYLIRVESDSILYFSSTMPKKYQPKAGMKLATGISHKLPYGLNHRVLSVENQGGILRVVTTHTSIEDVYKHLDYCIDKGISAPDIGNLSAEELEALGYELHDSIIFDWNDYDIAKGLKEKRPVITRSEDEDIEEEREVDKSGIEKTTFLDFFIDTRDVSSIKDGVGIASSFRKNVNDAILKTKIAHAEAVKDRISSDFYAGFGLKIEKYERVHAERREADEYELNYSDTWTDFTGKVEVGFEASKNTNYGKDYATEEVQGVLGKDFLDGLKAGIKGKALPKSIVNEKRSWDNAKIRIILCTTPIPIAFVASATLTPEITINGSICASGGYTTAKRRVGYEVKNGQKTDIDKEVEPGESHFDNVVGNGSFKIGANFRAAAGLEFVGTLNVTIGANVDAFFEAEVSCDITDAINTALDDNEESSIMDALDGNIKLYSDFYGDIRLQVAPFGINLLEKQLTQFLTVHLVNLSYKYKPSFHFVKGNAKTDETHCEIKGYYQVSDLGGLNSIIGLRTYYPGMRLYFGPIKENNYRLMHPLDENFEPIMTRKQGLVTTGKTYWFKYDGEIPKNTSEMHLVPDFIAYKYENSLFDPEKYIADEMIFKDEQYLVESGTPSIQLVTADQVCGERLNSWDDFTEGYIDASGTETGGHSTLSDPRDFSIFKYYGVVDVRNGTHIASWGARVTIYDSTGKVLLSPRKVPFNVNKSGRYTLLLSFISNWQPKLSIEGGDKLYIQIRPYWKDANGGTRHNANDAVSKTKWPIEYEREDRTGSLKAFGGSEEWGTILPEKELEQEHDYD